MHKCYKLKVFWYLLHINQYDNNKRRKGKKIKREVGEPTNNWHVKRKCLEGHLLNEESSNQMPVNYGLPQGSVLRPLLFTIKMLPLGSCIRIHGISFQSYADDTQFYISSRLDETSK